MPIGYLYKEDLDEEFIKEKLSIFYKNKTRKNRISIIKIEKDTERCLHIISSILYTLYSKKRKGKNIPYTEYVPLYSQILKTILGTSYKSLLDFLLSEEIIETRLNDDGNQSYQAGYISKVYRINRKYTKSKTSHKQYKFLTEAIEKAQLKNYNDLSPIHKHLYSFLKDLYFENGYNWQKRHLPNIEMFKCQNGNTNYKVDKSGRSYHKLTNMFSFSRHFLKYNDENLVSIDCANSQPLLLYNFYERENNVNDDAIKYRDLVISGNFYEYLLKKYSEKYKKNYIRKEFKELVYTYILFNHRKFNKDILKIFKEEFPSIYMTISLNQRFKDDLSSKLRYEESELWINKIANNIYKYNKEIPIFVLHDSIFTTQKYYKEVYKIIKDTFSNELGYIPKLHKKFYGKDSKDFMNDSIEYDKERIKLKQ